MPGLDKTGPMGQGSQTGRKMGRCNRKTKHKLKNGPAGVDSEKV